MLTFALICAFLALLMVYYLMLKQDSLIRILLKYIDLHSIDHVGSPSLASSACGQGQSDKIIEEHRNDIYHIPGPRILPWIGTRWQYYGRYSLPKIHEAYQDLNRRFGDIVLEVGNGEPYIHLFSRADIEKVLRSPSKYPFRPPVDIVQEYRKTRPDRYASLGLAQEQGEVWHSLRSGLVKGLSSVEVLNNYKPKLEQVVDEFVSLIRRKRNADGVIYKFNEQIQLFGLEALAGLILDRRLGILDPNPPFEIVELARAAQQIFITFRDVFYGSSLWKYLPTRTWTKYVQAEELIYNQISEIVDQTMAKQNLNNNYESVQTINEEILASGLDIRDKKSGLIDLFTSGIETLARSMSIALHHLTQNPECQERIFEELQTGISTENLFEATYSKAFMQESYRVAPTAFVIARLVEEDMQLSGYHIKRGTFALCHSMVANAKDENFHEAKKFIPERWISSSDFHQRTPKPAHSPSLACPFGVGRRMCPGKRFSDMEMLMVLTRLVEEFEIEFLGESDLVCEFMLGPRDVNVRFRDRQRV